MIRCLQSIEASRNPILLSVLVVATYLFFCAGGSRSGGGRLPSRHRDMRAVVGQTDSSGAAALPDFEDAPRLSSLYDARSRLCRSAGETAKADMFLNNGFVHR